MQIIHSVGVAYRAAKHFDHIVNAMKPLNIAVELQSKEEAEHISSMCGTDAMGRNHDEILPPKVCTDHMYYHCEDYLCTCHLCQYC